jgi:hypothetical protein
VKVSPFSPASAEARAAHAIRTSKAILSLIDMVISPRVGSELPRREDDGWLSASHHSTCGRRRADRAAADLERDDFSSNRHPALAYWWSMIFSENRYPLFGIML